MFLRNTSPALWGISHPGSERDTNDLQPLLRTPNVPGSDTRKAVSLEIVRIDWSKQQVDGVDFESLTTESQRNDRSISAWDDKTVLAVALCSGDLGVDGFGISGGSDNEGGAGVEDGGAALEPEVLVTNGHGEITLPEAVLVDVLEGNEGVRVELGLVKTSKRDLAIIETIGNSGNLVGRDGFADQPLLRKSLNRRRDTLVGKDRLG